jgi:hypothetical protein
VDEIATREVSSKLLSLGVGRPVTLQAGSTQVCLNTLGCSAQQSSHGAVVANIVEFDVNSVVKPSEYVASQHA